MISQTLQSYQKITNDILGRFTVAKEIYKKEKDFLLEAQIHEEDAREAQQIVQEISQEIQQQVHNQIANVVSTCLETVFDEPYDFKINFERKRGKTEASLFFEKDGEEIDPLTASGGGVVDIASFALQLSCIMLSREPKLRKIFIADEPFKFVSAEYRGRVKQLLEKLSKEMDIQFIIVTHIEELKTGNIIEL